MIPEDPEGLAQYLTNWTLRCWLADIRGKVPGTPSLSQINSELADIRNVARAERRELRRRPEALAAK